MTAAYQRASAGRFPDAVDEALRAAGWRPGRWDMRQAEVWADTLRDHTSDGGHRHAVFPAVVEAWAEFGGLEISPTAPGRDLAPRKLRLDPLAGLHAARTLGDLGQALDTRLAPLGAEADDSALLAIDAVGRVYALDHTGDWYLGAGVDAGLTTLIGGVRPVRLTPL
ncbi:SUKH-3 domain-containing protein [Streptomyces oceani]|uniref:SUKH-3 domain containing protein n=1 Tax=Streptomyces oceani TaxID=1075402 RepID=A0A1E7KND3_9ACTN|nr:SUKH-3 domain-containing protein [Streptomyces oceani]OEV05341.1 SUKH-3 domain containing protein [Streptomyces oceani]